MLNKLILLLLIRQCVCARVYSIVHAHSRAHTLVFESIKIYFEGFFIFHSLWRRSSIDILV